MWGPWVRAMGCFHDRELVELDVWLAVGLGLGICLFAVAIGVTL